MQSNPALRVGTKCLLIATASAVLLQGCQGKSQKDQVDKSIGRHGATEGEKVYQWGAAIRFGKGGNASEYQGTGWSGPETGYTWTLGKRATLILKTEVPKAESVTMSMWMWPLLKPGRLDSQTVEISVNGKNVGRFVLMKLGRLEYTVSIPSSQLNTSGTSEIAFDLPDARSPAEIEYNNDKRVLGAAFSEIKLVEAQGSAESSKAPGAN